MVSITVRAGTEGHGMVMNGAFRNLGDPVRFLLFKKWGEKYGKEDKIGFNQAGMQQVRNGTPNRKSE
jgi:hypothetical protein